MQELEKHKQRTMRRKRTFCYMLDWTRCDAHDTTSPLTGSVSISNIWQGGKLKEALGTKQASQQASKPASKQAPRQAPPHTTQPQKAKPSHKATKRQSRQTKGTKKLP